MNLLSSHHDIICHSTDKTSRSPDTFLPQPSASLSTASFSLRHASPWILPPIPNFSELGLRFDKSQATSLNATATGGTTTLTTHHSFSDLYDQIEQRCPRLATPTGFTTTTQSVGSNGISINMAQELHWSLPQPCLKSNAPVAQDVVPELESSIFDDLQSDSNETFIVWNIPLLSSKPMQCTPHTTSSPIPSTPLTQNSVLPPAHTPTSSTAHSFQASTPLTVSIADPANGRTQDRVLLKPRSAEGSGKYLKQDVEQAAGTRQDASPSTRVSETTHSPAKDRLIMAATAEKLVQKLTSDIGKDFL